MKSARFETAAMKLSEFKTEFALIIQGRIQVWTIM